MLPIDSLLHSANFTQIDIAYSVAGYLARFQADPQDFHWMLSCEACFLQYTYKVLEIWVWNSMHLFVDADHAGDTKTCKFIITGFVI
jgi:hypothetical protein